MALASDRCICLRRTEYSETSQILSLFGQDHGVFRVIAKGAHRRTKAGASKFDGGVDLLDFGQAIFTFDPARDLNILTEWNLLEGHLHLRESMRAMDLANYTAELTGSLMEELDPHVPLFHRLKSCLMGLGSTRTEEIFLAFELDLLRETGHLPELRQCAECGTPADAGMRSFSPSRGGIICQNCEGAVGDRFSVDIRLIRLAGQILQLPRSNGIPQRLPHLSRYQTDPLNLVLARHVEQSLGRRLKMLRYVSPRIKPGAVRLPG